MWEVAWVMVSGELRWRSNGRYMTDVPYDDLLERQRLQALEILKGRTGQEYEEEGAAGVEGSEEKQDELESAVASQANQSDDEGRLSKSSKQGTKSSYIMTTSQPTGHWCLGQNKIDRGAAIRLVLESKSDQACVVMSYIGD